MLAAVFGVADVFRARADSFGSGGLKQNPNLRKYLFVLGLKNIVVQDLFPCTCGSSQKRFFFVSKCCHGWCNEKLKSPGNKIILVGP